MREIKFRYRIQEKFTKEIQTHFLTLQGLEEGAIETGIGKSWKVLTRDQSIGCNDKNNKNIYEKDIVKHPDCDDYIVIDWCYDRWIQNVYYKETPNYGANYKWYKLEVIGNIYENKELLK